MAAIYASLKDVVSVRMKSRHDGVCEQYNRIFMMKVLCVGSMMLGLNWYTDKIRCIIPEGEVKVSEEYISEACWIRGFYIYRDIGTDADEVAHHGIPKNLDHNGKYPSNGKLCVRDSDRTKSENDECTPLQKTVFTQYQYLPLLTTVLALFYYVPHIAYKIINADLITLRDGIGKLDGATILRNYFDFETNSRLRMRLRVLGNIVVNTLYICSNLTSWFVLDVVLGSGYKSFGWDWVRAGYESRDYSERAAVDVRPSQLLLPTFGICKVHEGARSLGVTRFNNHVFICEYSQHILCHYVLIFLWFTIQLGILFSLLGFILLLVSYCVDICGFVKQIRLSEGRYRLTFREYEYLELIRRKNTSLHHRLRDAIVKERMFGGSHHLHHHTPPHPTVETIPGSRPVSANSVYQRSDSCYNNNNNNNNNNYNHSNNHHNNNNNNNNGSAVTGTCTNSECGRICCKIQKLL